MFPGCERDEDCSEEEECNPRTKTCEKPQKLYINAKGRSGQFGHPANMDKRSRRRPSHVEYQDLDEDDKTRAKFLYEGLMEYVNRKSQEWEKKDARGKMMNRFKPSGGDKLVEAYEKYLALNQSK